MLKYRWLLMPIMLAISIVRADIKPYIANTSSELAQLEIPTEHYAAELDEGIDFTKPGYPKFIIGVAGMSGYEKTHRWTDANIHKSAIFKFSEPLPRRFTLAIKAWSIGPNSKELTKIKVGDLERFIRITDTPRTSTILFENVPETDMIEIIPYSPKSPMELSNGLSQDTRKLGVAIIELKIQHGWLFELGENLKNTISSAVEWCITTFYRIKYQSMLNESGLPPSLLGN